jgi:hypothetical protein
MSSLIVKIKYFCNKFFLSYSKIFYRIDPLSLDNYRPITLLNTDTKILAYTIAQRLKEVLPSIIHSDQKGYAKDRYIGFNIRQIQDVIDHSEKLT